MTSSHPSSVKLRSFSKEHGGSPLGRGCRHSLLSLGWLQVDNHLSMMYIHVFAAYFGLTVAWCLSRPLPKEAEEKEQRTTSPSLFAMLGKGEAEGRSGTWVSKRLQNSTGNLFHKPAPVSEALRHDSFPHVALDEFRPLSEAFPSGVPLFILIQRRGKLPPLEFQ